MTESWLGEIEQTATQNELICLKNVEREKERDKKSQHKAKQNPCIVSPSICATQTLAI